MKTLVLFNGGLKDTFLASLARKEGEAILCHFVLRQQDLAGLPRLTTLATTLNLPLFVHELWEAPPLEEVLLRMLYLLLHALPIAKEKQVRRIYHGLGQDDDPRIVTVLDIFAKQLSDLILLAQPLYDGKGFWLGNIEIETPLRRLDRPRVIRLGNEYSIPWELTHSCCQSSTKHCGECQDCIRRRNAFKREGHEDPTRYYNRSVHGQL